MEQFRLTDFAKTSGCAAKLSPVVLAGVVANIPKQFDEKLMVGVETSDDAAVYRISDELAMIQTVDFFPPMVNDPYTFGQIAAANALSDIYAMGGNPKLALNLVEFPGCLETTVLEEILKGGANKAAEAGVVIAGGHSIVDDVPKYGLCVTGFVHPDKIWTNAKAKPGDSLILTKPVGSGILTTAIKAGFASESEQREVISVLTLLNRRAKECLEQVRVDACTDVTGFGVIGHSLEMAQGSKVSLKLYANRIPLISGALSYASLGLIPQGAYANRKLAKNLVEIKQIEENMEDVFFDPQTSGGLLAAVPKGETEKVLALLSEVLPSGSFACIGEVTERKEYAITVEKG